ncbi:uncharacterized protein B0H18DRAFT_681476 [Fomitopsis serialis]|nr:uncharacterized protein B0H18DRAFT_681476 [Neoantrodia serialis]KAH9918171.1 hypothetical protein B0H18DRAFT_681476 [Neoantrodia serialis]
MTELVLKNGDSAAATLRKPEAIADLSSQYGPDRLLVAKLDVTNNEEIKAAFNKAAAHFGRIDVVFNNAGYALFGEAEGIPDDLAREAMEVDFWGAANVSREAVRVFREVNKPAGGFLLQVSSASGLIGLPGLSYYCAPKHALEGFTKGLAAELNPEWNIKVCIVEPGGFRTPALSKMVHAPPHPAYMTPASATWRERERSKGVQYTPNMADPATAVEMMYKITSLPDPPIQLPLGKDCLTMVRGTLAKLQRTVDAYASWSDELQPEGEYQWESMAS